LPRTRDFDFPRTGLRSQAGERDFHAIHGQETEAEVLARRVAWFNRGFRIIPGSNGLWTYKDEFDREEHRRFIEDAIQEKIARERKGKRK
jgi:hypothetical protein